MSEMSQYPLQVADKSPLPSPQYLRGTSWEPGRENFFVLDHFTRANEGAEEAVIGVWSQEPSLVRITVGRLHFSGLSVQPLSICISPLDCVPL